MRLQVSQPSMPGICQSTKMVWYPGWSACAQALTSAMAWAPSLATSTCQPQERAMAAMMSRAWALSSTTSTRRGLVSRTGVRSASSRSPASAGAVASVTVK